MSTSLRTHRSGGAGGLPSNPRSNQRTQPAQPSQSRDAYAGYNDPPDTLFSSSRSASRAGNPASGRQDRGQYDTRSDYGSRADDRYGRAQDDRYGRGDDRYAAPSDDRYSQQSSTYDERPTSNTSTASSASSLLDRMKQRSNVSSARTSIDDDPPQTAKANSSLRTRTAFQSRQREPEPEDEPTRGAPVPSGEGSSIWGRMVAATSSLRVNVTTAISSVTREDGEETPPGQESRLTRTMKEYYLRKARDPNDLPSWLFEPMERSLSSKPSNISSSTSSSSRSRPAAREDPPPTQSRGLRDIYDRAQQQQQPPPLARSPTMAQSSESRAASRLKAMREAKRSAVGATREYDAYYRSDQQPPQQQQYESEPEPESRRPGRVGLPSRPGAGRY